MGLGDEHLSKHEDLNLGLLHPYKGQLHTSVTLGTGQEDLYNTQPSPAELVNSRFSKRLSQKTSWSLLDILVHTCNSNTLEAETGGSL